MPMIRARWGRIVNISSVAALTGNRGQVNYSAAKGALHSATRSLALETASRGVTVNAVAPGYVDTEMVRAVPAEVLQKIVAKVPTGRLGRAQDISRAVLFLVDEDAIRDFSPRGLAERHDRRPLRHAHRRRGGHDDGGDLHDRERRHERPITPSRCRTSCSASGRTR